MAGTRTSSCRKYNSSRMCKVLKTLFAYIRDPLLHSAGAVVFTILCLAGGMSPAYAAAMNTGFWLFREWDQTRFSVPVWRWSLHKHIEWITPGVAGVVVGGVA